MSKKLTSKKPPTMAEYCFVARGDNGPVVVRDIDNVLWVVDPVAATMKQVVAK